MNRLIYYLMVFLFSVGVSVGITNSIIDFMFVITSLVVYMITLYLYKTVDQKLVIKFYNLIAAIFIIVEGSLLQSKEGIFIERLRTINGDKNKNQMAHKYINRKTFVFNSFFYNCTIFKACSGYCGVQYPKEI